MNKIKTFFWVVVFWITLQLAAITDARLLRMPDIHDDLIVFVYAGDLWSVPARGGQARQLTTHPGIELMPRISPDGKWVAFSGEYSGSRQIHVIPINGGTPRQLTYYNDSGVAAPRAGFDHLPVDWTPDSRGILFLANRSPYDERTGKYFLASLDGGLEKPLPLTPAGFGRFSQDGKKIAYTPIFSEFRTWKRYQGGMAQDIWIYDLEENHSERVTDFKGTDRQPFWYKNYIYFVSDRDLTLNMYSYDLSSRQVIQITSFKDYDVLFPSGHGNQITYENGGHIYVLNLDTRESRKISVDIRFDNPNVIPYFKNVARYVGNNGMQISSSGKQAVLAARGDIFLVPEKEGPTMNLTQTPGIREMLPVWSPDGAWIACVADATGEYEIYLLDPKGEKKPQALTRDHRVYKFPLVWSPDSRSLVFYTSENNLQLLDISDQSLVTIDHEDKGDIDDYSWSPDSQWLAYSKRNQNNLSSIQVYSLKQKKLFPLIPQRFKSYSPVFSSQGEYLFFLADVDFKQMNFSDVETDFQYNKVTKILAVGLTAQAPKLFPDKDYTEGGANPAAGKKTVNPSPGQAGQKPVHIDFSGLEDRIVSLPLKSGNYSLETEIEKKIIYRDGETGGIYTFNLEDKKNELIIKDIKGYVISRDGKKLLYRGAEDTFGILEIKPGQKAGDGQLDLAGVTMKIDPQAEWRQIFAEEWRLYKNFFYVFNMHGVDWQKIREKYRSFLPYVSHRMDLDFIMGEMIAELNVGHAYISSGDFPKIPRWDTGLLGAELRPDLQSGRYRIGKIFQGENWDDSTRSPLTGPGVNVKEGDYLMQLNGHDVTLKDNPYEFLENTVKKRVKIVVNEKPQIQGARASIIEPVASEANLFYLEWVRYNRKLVDRLSGGRIGYIHVPDTFYKGNREFFQGFFAQSDKEALIIDDRFNGGGITPLKMISKLSQKTEGYWKRQGVPPSPEPSFSFDGPMAMLINYAAGSGGDYFPYLFRKKKLGPLIGTRTWGGLVGIGGTPDLIDGTGTSIPQSGFMDTDGHYAVEGVGIHPDPGFEIFDLPEEAAQGKDACIEAAVKYLLQKLNESPAKKAMPSPPDPDRSKWFIE